MAKSKFTRGIIATISAMVLSFNLTACDPPMPPDVAAQILEQSYTCELGDITVSYPDEMQDPAAQWADSLQYACVDPLPAMSLTTAEAGLPSDMLVSSYPADAAVCKPNFAVPFALDAAAVAFQLADSSSLNLKPETLAAILNGEITNWNDAQIAEDNAGTVFPDLAITIRKTADQNSLSALQTWMTSLKQDISGAGIKAQEGVAFNPLAEGEVAIMPNSQVLNAGLYAVSLITATDSETGEQKLATADNLGISSAGSQLVPKKNGASVTFSLDSKIKPTAQEGLNEAAQPYQAIFPVYLYACGEDTLLKHASALFLLRLDSQGVLAASNFNPLPERVRFESLDVARTGLATPTELPAE